MKFIKITKDDLEDIVATRNDELKAARIDDVTIAKVEFSKTELDHSLFEYEQHKMTKNNISSQRISDFEDKNRSHVSDKNLYENLCQKFIRLEDIENEFYQFGLSAKFNIDINEAQSSLNSVLKNKSPHFNETEIKELKEKMKKDFNSKQNKFNGTESIIKGENIQPVNLNSLYKWEKIDKEVQGKEESTQLNIDEPECLDEMDINKKISIYSQCYVYYYQKNFKKNLI
jgi:hypothetical protein